MGTAEDLVGLGNVRQAWAFAVLGLSDAGVSNLADVERARQKTKELYKRHMADKKESDANKVLEAFELVKQKVKGMTRAAQQSEPAPKRPKTKDSAALSEVGANSNVITITRRDGEPWGMGVTSDPHWGIVVTKVKPEGVAARCKFEVGTTFRAIDGKDARGMEKAELMSLMKRKSSFVLEFGRKHAPGAALPQHGRGSAPDEDPCFFADDPLDFFPSDASPSQQDEAALGATQDRFRLLAGSDMTAAIANVERNAGQPLTILVCSCGQTCNLEKTPTLGGGAFLCPSCRFRAMDPFNPVIEGEKGMVKLVFIRPPLIEDDKLSEASFKLVLRLPNVDAWIKAGHNIEVRMCRSDTCDVAHAWPDTLSFHINGRETFDIQPPKPGKIRRDVPRHISTKFSSGDNVVKVSLKADRVASFVLAFVRTYPRIPKQLLKHVACLAEDDCRQRMAQILFGSVLSSTGDEVHTSGSDRTSLTCPVTLARMETPVRGHGCRHLQCFDLKAYLVSNYRMAAFNRRWRCPVCNIVLRPPRDVFIDTHVLHILSKTDAEDDEITFDNSGSWRVTGRVPSPCQDTSSEANDDAAAGSGAKASPSPPG